MRPDGKAVKISLASLYLRRFATQSRDPVGERGGLLQASRFWKSANVMAGALWARAARIVARGAPAAVCLVARRRAGSPSADGGLLLVEVPGGHAHQCRVFLECDTRRVTAVGDELALLLKHFTLQDDAPIARDQVLLGV